MVTIAEEVRPAAGSARARFVATIFVGSFLLFLVQPMIARMALPRLGGSPSVWNSAMLVYQALLLGGYAYAPWLGRLAPARALGPGGAGRHPYRAAGARRPHPPDRTYLGRAAAGRQSIPVGALAAAGV